MARFALLLPREEMVEPAGRIARELEMDVVLNQSVPTERILDLMEDCRRAGADILVARGRQASILKEHTDFPVVEIQLTGLEIARLLHRARSLVSHLERPKIGVVTIPNMVGNIQGFEEIFDIELHTYFISGLSEMERGAEHPWEIANMQFIRIKFTKAFFEKKPRNISRFYICLKEIASEIRCILRS